MLLKINFVWSYWKFYGLSDKMLETLDYGKCTIFPCVINGSRQSLIPSNERWWTHGQRPLQYIGLDKTNKDAAVYSKSSHPKGVMVYIMQMSHIKDWLSLLLWNQERRQYLNITFRKTCILMAIGFSIISFHFSTFKYR